MYKLFSTKLLFSRWFNTNLFSDIRRVNSQAVYAANTGMIILGGGVIKHHICNANLMVSLSQSDICRNRKKEKLSKLPKSLLTLKILP